MSDSLKKQPSENISSKNFSPYLYFIATFGSAVIFINSDPSIFNIVWLITGIWGFVMCSKMGNKNNTGRDRTWTDRDIFESSKCVVTDIDYHYMSGNIYNNDRE